MSDREALLLTLLRERFGHDRFRPLQEEIIANVLSGGDSLVLMPTGGGKSLCYQLPGLALPGVTLVVSPLIALMKDQVDALNAKGVAAEFINSSLSSREIEGAQARARRGEAKLLYAAPERLATPGFVRFLHSARLSLIAIDEAHCISEWGHEFRPDYRNLRQLREEFPRTPVIALTATATERVRQDIVEQLRLRGGGCSRRVSTGRTWCIRPFRRRRRGSSSGGCCGSAKGGPRSFTVSRVRRRRSWR